MSEGTLRNRVQQELHKWSKEDLVNAILMRFTDLDWEEWRAVMEDGKEPTKLRRTNLKVVTSESDA